MFNRSLVIVHDLLHCQELVRGLASGHPIRLDPARVGVLPHRQLALGARQFICSGYDIGHERSPILVLSDAVARSVPVVLSDHVARSALVVLSLSVARSVRVVLYRLLWLAH